MDNGLRLRALRNAYGKTQLDVELDANLGIGYLQRLELGKVQRPTRETLERIIDALDANFVERRNLLSQYGYAAEIVMPTTPESSGPFAFFRMRMRHYRPICSTVRITC